jgi:hypothetical protein
MRPGPCVSVALLVACSGAAPKPAAIPDWAVGSTPTLSIGTSEADPGHELTRVSGARRQGNGIIIANSGTHELQRFDTTGRFLGVEGREGHGPGEFMGILILSPAPGDSLYVLDGENLRWSIHEGTGRYGRTLSGGAESLARPAWLYHRVTVRSPAGAPVPAWVFTVLDSLPESAPGSPARQARLDDLGFLWLRDSASTRAWTVYAGAEPAIGRVVLPAGFELFQAGKNFVLGLERDSMDQEIVRGYRLARPVGLATPAALPAGVVPAGDREAHDRMFADLRGIMVAQEAFYSDHSSYTANADSLGATLSSGAELVLLAGDKRHWVGLFYDRATRTTCGVSVGSPAPEGWLDGTGFCGR